jgi:hypothetical protein
MGTLSGVEMGLALSGVPFARGGVGAAMDVALRRDEQPSPTEEMAGG